MEKSKVMIVEDEAITAMNIKAELISMGYEICSWVTTGKDAIKDAEQEKPDIILMDIILKGKMNGIEAATEICSRRDIPIIFMSGCEDEATMKQTEKLKPVGCFIKPVEIVDLKPVIEKALQ